MIMRLYRVCFFTALVLLILSDSYAQVRKRTNMDDGWKFRFGHAADPAKDFYYSLATVYSKSGGAARTAIEPRFNDSAWRSLSLPHDWVVELPL